MPLSRRQFLQLAGITLLNVSIPLPNLSARAESYGRTLLATPVRSGPDQAAPVVDHLWPDSLVPVQALEQGWYRTAAGFVEKRHIQPILLAPATAHTATALPFWAEVSAPVTVVRQWCAADAPLVTRIGHGGVAQVIDYLPGSPAWYGIANEHGDLLGWSQQGGWQPAALRPADTALALRIQVRSHRMTVYANQEAVLQTAVSTSQTLAEGVYPLERGDMGGQHCCTAQADFYGVPWHMHIQDQGALHGVYWHNQFGEAAPGAAVQVVPYVARWLYEHCGPGSRLIIETT